MGDFDDLLAKQTGDFDDLLAKQTVTSKPTYKEQAPSLLQKVNDVGYSGLSDDDKALYNAQFPHSNWAKADPKRTVEDAQRLTDEAVRNRKIVEPVNPYMTGENPIDAIKNTASDSYDAVRGVLSRGVASFLALPVAAFDKYEGVNPDGTAKIKHPSTTENVPEGEYPRRSAGFGDRYVGDWKQLVDEGQAGDGVMGIAADPLNLTMFVPGLGEYVMGGKFAQQFPKIAAVGNDIIQTSQRGDDIEKWGSLLGRGVLGGIEGAGYGVGSILIDPTKKDESVKAAAGWGAGLGFVGNTLAGALKRSAIDNFPGVDKIERGKMSGRKNTGMIDLSVAERARIYDMLPLISGRRAYYEAGQDLTQSTQEAYRKADEIFDKLLETEGWPYGGIAAENLREIIRNKMLEHTKAGKGNMLQNLVDENQIDDYLTDKFSKIEFTAKQTPRKNYLYDENAAKIRDEAELDRDDILGLLDEQKAEATERLSSTMKDLDDQITAARGDQAKVRALKGQKSKAQSDHAKEIKKLSDEQKAEATEMLPRGSEQFKSDIIPISNLGNILGHLNTDIGRLMSKYPTADNKMALVAKDAIVSDVLGNKGVYDDLISLAKQIGTGSIVRNGKIQSYNDILEEIVPGTRENYSLGKRLLGTIAQQIETGPSVRLGMPGMGEIGPHTYLRLKGNYVAPALSWKAGKLLSRPLAAPTMELGSRLLNGIRKPIDSTKQQ